MQCPWMWNAGNSKLFWWLLLALSFYESTDASRLLYHLQQTIFNNKNPLSHWYRHFCNNSLYPLTTNWLKMPHILFIIPIDDILWNMPKQFFLLCSTATCFSRLVKNLKLLMHKSFSSFMAVENYSIEFRYSSIEKKKEIFGKMIENCKFFVKAPYWI